MQVTVYVERDNLALRLHDIPLETKGIEVAFTDLPEPGTIDEWQGEYLKILRREVDLAPDHPGRALLIVEPVNRAETNREWLL